MKTFKKLDKNEIKMIIGGITGFRLTVTNSMILQREHHLAKTAVTHLALQENIVKMLFADGARRFQYDCDHDGWGV